MKTLLNSKSKKVRTIEVKCSNMTFIVKVESHYMASLNNPTWSANKYTATIKETGMPIGGYGGRKQIKDQMNIINSKPHLFLN